MISGLTSGAGVVVNGGYSPPYINTSAPSAGIVRYNNSNLEVYDGSSWRMLSTGIAQVSLDANAQSVIQWANKKMAEEAEIIALASKYPAVKDLKEKLDLVIALVRDYKEEQV